MGAHVVGTLGQQEIAPGAEQEQDRAAARVGVLGRDEPGEVVGGHLLRRADQRLQPVGDHPPAPRYFFAAAATSARVSMEPASMRTIAPLASTNAVIGSPGMWGSGAARSSVPPGSATSG